MSTFSSALFVGSFGVDCEDAARRLAKDREKRVVFCARVYFFNEINDLFHITIMNLTLGAMNFVIAMIGQEFVFIVTYPCTDKKKTIKRTIVFAFCKTKYTTFQKMTASVFKLGCRPFKAMTDRASLIADVKFDRLQDWDISPLTSDENQVNESKNAILGRVWRFGKQKLQKSAIFWGVHSFNSNEVASEEEEEEAIINEEEPKRSKKEIKAKRLAANDKKSQTAKACVDNDSHDKHGVFFVVVESKSEPEGRGGGGGEKRKREEKKKECIKVGRGMWMERYVFFFFFFLREVKFEDFLGQSVEEQSYKKKEDDSANKNTHNDIDISNIFKAFDDIMIAAMNTQKQSNERHDALMSNEEYEKMKSTFHDENNVHIPPPPTNKRSIQNSTTTSTETNNRHFADMRKSEPFQRNAKKNDLP
ncbi:hypothetical protein RFI_13996 [Reticulomyxa filosa]|uniref:Uncharacterized protein n=1 Tax=Reticulomyxa filosa TaxID=46433 RepID=X6NBN1_RETFI|nr:hypothetical protein RFI_13996 [Reticulomyxa filosa]|eukprot:ETO23189.1 hypothetical protein RFI_13996 [Reticulomyxa filosa]